ncbi:MAG: MFS transporter [Acidobacteria bacterium]|nr:MFS transporter [Acidobacteriota bacterium]
MPTHFGSNPISLSAYWRLMRSNRNFRRLWSAQVVSEIGDWFYALAIYSLLLELTGRAESVALAVVLQVLPQTFVGPSAGVLNDRISRRRVMITSDLARALIVLAMLAVRTRELVWLVYPLLLAETMMAGFFEPARSAVIPNVVPREEIAVANTLSTTTWSLNLAIGSALGGITAFFLGRDAVFLLNALSFLLSAVLIRRMEFGEPHLAGAAPFRFRELAGLAPIQDGFRYVRSDPRLFATLFVKTGLGFMGANNVLLPLLGRSLFRLHVAGAGPERQAMLGMSLLMGARGFGALMGPLVSGSLAGGQESRFRAGIVFGFLLAAAGYVGIGLAGSGWLTALLVILAHAGGSTIWVLSTTLLHLYTQDRFRGRVFAAELALCMLTISTSSYLAGVAVDGGVPVRSFAFYMGLSLLVPAAAWSSAQRLWR